MGVATVGSATETRCRTPSLSSASSAPRLSWEPSATLAQHAQTVALARQRRARVPRSVSLHPTLQPPRTQLQPAATAVTCAEATALRTTRARRLLYLGLATPTIAQPPPLHGLRMLQRTVTSSHPASPAQQLPHSPSPLRPSPVGSLQSSLFPSSWCAAAH